MATFLSSAHADAAHRVGNAMARDVLAAAGEIPWGWTGLDPQDADQLTAVGITPGTPEWDEAEELACTCYSAAIPEDFRRRHPRE